MSMNEKTSLTGQHGVSLMSPSSAASGYNTEDNNNQNNNNIAINSDGRAIRNYTFGSGDDVGNQLPATNASLIDVDDDEDDAIDIQALQEVAKRLDIPLSALLQQLRRQQQQDAGEDEEEDSLDGSGSARSDASSPVQKVPEGAFPLDMSQPAAAGGGLGLERCSQRESVAATPTSHRATLAAGARLRNSSSLSSSTQTDNGAAASGSSVGKTATVGCDIFIPSATKSGKQIRIKGAVSDMEESSGGGRLTSPAFRLPGVSGRFPTAAGLFGSKTNLDETASNPSAPMLREAGGGDSDGAESMKTAKIGSGGGEDEEACTGPASVPSTNPSFYDNAQVPARSALNKKASVASSTSATASTAAAAKRIDSKVSAGSSKQSQRRFGRVGATSGREKMLRGNSAESNSAAMGVKKAVHFGELQQVHVFEVDNSLYISIEYSRPLIGWVLLFVGVFLRVFMNAIDVYKLARDHDAAYGFSTGRAIGRASICLLIVFPLWFFFLKPTKREARFLKSLSGVSLVIATGIIYTFSTVAQQSASRITGQWRSLATYSLHPAIIVLYGKVFRNSVFVEELVGVAILAVGFFLAMAPMDIRVDEWYFAEIITFAQSIYVSSFLFLAVKARGNQVSVPVTMASVSFFSLIIQLIVCAVVGVPFDNATNHSAFEFMRGENLGWFFASTLCDVVSLACCLLALRFIPPLTVSTSWVIEPLLTQLVASFLFFNEQFRVWNMCTDEFKENNSGLVEFCGTDAFSPWYASGAMVAVLATGYIIYVSTIKRSKVEMLIKKLKKRKTPKNPYKARSSDDGSLSNGQRRSSVDRMPNPLNNAMGMGGEGGGAYGAGGLMRQHSPNQSSIGYGGVESNGGNGYYNSINNNGGSSAQQLGGGRAGSRSRDNVYPIGQIYGGAPPPRQQQQQQ